MTKQAHIFTRIVDNILLVLIAFSFVGAILFGATGSVYAAEPVNVTNTRAGMIHVGFAIADQGNTALRQIQQDSSLSQDQLQLPSRDSDYAETAKVQGEQVVAAAKRPSPCDVVKNTVVCSPDSFLEEFFKMFSFA